MKKIKNYIGGKLIAPVSGNYIDNYNPATGKVYSLIPDSDVSDVDLAVQAAKSAFNEWSETPADERSNIMLKVANLINKNLDEFAEAESIDNGKPFKLAKTIDIPRAIKNFEFFATSILHFESEFHETDRIALNYTLRQPIGITGAISPWNLPLYLFTWKIAPAIATGNCVIAKPSEITPMSAYLLSQVCMEAGMPPGVLNIIHGHGAKAGSAIVSHPDIKAVTFTGGTKTGADIARVAAPMFKKLSLELGGKNPVIIFADCDYEKMLETTVRSSFTNQGQICLCGSRIFVQENIYERFREDFVEKVKALKIGDPLKDGTDQGALVSEQHMNKVLSYIELAKEEGGNILCGGNRVKLSGRCSEGWFIEPTVIEGLTHECRTNTEEIFGPVVTIQTFTDENDAVLKANCTEYGLASVIWTENLTKAHRVSSQIHSGIVWVNCWMLRDLRTPFGGMKSSGVGREGGTEALKFFTEAKNICIKLN